MGADALNGKLKASDAMFFLGSYRKLLGNTQGRIEIVIL